MPKGGKPYLVTSGKKKGGKPKSGYGKKKR